MIMIRLQKFQPLFHIFRRSGLYFLVFSCIFFYKIGCLLVEKLSFAPRDTSQRTSLSVQWRHNDSVIHNNCVTLDHFPITLDISYYLDIVAKDHVFY